MPPILDDEELERRERLAALAEPTRLRPLEPGTRGYDLAVGSTAQPRIPERRIGEAEAPEVGRLHPASSDLLSPSSPSRLRPLSFQDRQRLPTVSAGAPAGSFEFYRNQVARIEDQKAHPWGSEENHPGRLGRIGHVLSRIGNIAGDVIDPAAMAIIPGTDLHRNIEESGAEKKLAGAETRESEIAERKAQTENIESEAAARQNPKPKLLSGEENVRTDQGGNRERAYELPDTSIQWKPEGAPQRLSPIGDTNATPQFVYGKPKTGTDEEQFVAKYLKDNKLPDTAENRLAGVTQYKNGAPIGDTDAKQLTTQIANALKDTGIDPKGYTVTGKSTRGEANEALKAAQAAANEHRATTAPDKAQSRKDAHTMGYALDASGKMVYTNKAEADKRGATFEEMKADAVNKDRQSLRQLNDIQKNIAEYRKAIDAFHGPIENTAAMRRIMAGVNQSDVEKMGYLTMGALMNSIEHSEVSNSWNKLNDQEKAVMIGYLRAKGAMIAYNRVVSGSSRSNKEALEVEWANLPSPDVGADAGDKQMEAMQQNLDQVNQGYPTNLPGMKVPEEVRQNVEGRGDDKPPSEAAPGMKWQHRTVDGKTEWRQVKAQQ